MTKEAAGAGFKVEGLICHWSRRPLVTF